MKKLIRILFLTIMCFFVTSNSATLNVRAAETNEVSGIEIMISSDKDEYNSNEKATINYSIKNNSETNLNSLNWKLTLPEKLSLTSGDLSGKEITVNAGETIDGSAIIMMNNTANSTTTSNAATTTTTTVQKTDSAKTGDYVNIAIPTSIILIASAIAFITRKKGKKTLMFFCFLTCATCISAFIPTNTLAAEYDRVKANVDKTLKIGNSDYKIEFSVDFDPDAYEVSVSNQLYAWADYSQKDNTITLQWLKQENAISYKVYEKNASKKAIAEVSDKTEYVYNINTSDIKDEYIFYIKAINTKDQSLSNDVIVKREKSGMLSFEDIDSDNDGITDLKEIRLNTNRLDQDTDKDGLIDGYEVLTVKTDPLTVASRESGISDGEDDIDGDGLTNANEYNYSTNPFVGDTDEDGFPDGYEVLNGMDPLKLDNLSLETINVSELDDNREYDLEILNLTEEQPLDIFYNEDDNVETINGVFTDRQIKCAQDAFRAICNVRSLLGIKDPQNELKFSKLDTNKYFSSYSFDIEYKGIEVYGRDITVTCDLEGKVSSITSYYISNEILDKINTVPTISEKDISNIINKDSESKAEITSCNLYIKPDTDTVLAYNVITSDNEAIWINAHSGEIISRIKMNNRASASYGADVEYNKENGMHYMNYHDKVALYDWNDSEVKGTDIPDIIKETGFDSYSYFSDSTPDPVNPNDPDAKLTYADAKATYENAVSAYEWYNSHYYSGIDGCGKPVPVFINDKDTRNQVDTSELSTLSASEIDDIVANGTFTYNDYFASFDEEYCYEYITFTIRANGYDDKKTAGYSLALVGHEFGHAVFKHKCGIKDFNYATTSNINKTINEAYADIFGSCVEGKWIERRRPNRNIAEPNKTGNPCAMNDSYFDPSFSEEHKNSTVISHAAYLMNTKYGIDMETVWKLFYYSLGKIKDHTDFKGIRGIIIQTARNLKYSETIINNIGHAFDEVNIIEQKGSVQIQVLDHNQPLKNGLVSIVKSDNIIKQLNTNEAGIALFDDLDAGTYDVRVKSPDGQVIYTKVTIISYKTTYKTIYFGTGSTNFDWVHYDHYNYDQKIGATLAKHINISDSEIKMIGYTEDPIKDFLVTNENENESSIIHSKQKNISFSLKRDKADWHTMEGGGFLFDVSLSNEDVIDENGKKIGSKTGKITAHCLLVTKEGLKLCFLNNVDISKMSDGNYKNVIGLDSTYISNMEEHNRNNFNPQYTKLGQTNYNIGDVLDEHNFTIRIDKSNKEYITVWDNDKIIINNLCINKLEGDDFGPITSHINHWCPQVSYFTFSDIKINLVSVT
ncbi:M4 family metallopeptidase [Ruminococcus flavefaciens]|uniref:Zn-dependent metalloprotease n=1 Tax=Ruminococcus flavefaciens TaxID=1265 RepID=A0A1M7G859_RUMFL|nr:M4 family metallopeptidase [Ruminococcus flavefaciens]SHM12470.1 Zn-dependent metalloprotease [Ruminococcus flavefaciens]